MSLVPEKKLQESVFPYVPIGCIRVARNYNTCRLRASLSAFADDGLILTLCSVEIKSLVFTKLASCGMITLGKQLTLLCHFVDKPGDFSATSETFRRFLNFEEPYYGEESSSCIFLLLY